MMREKSPPIEKPTSFKPPRSAETAAIMNEVDRQDSVEADTSAESQGEDDGSPSERPTKRAKRSRACIACRNMKIRCLPVEGQEACLPCSKVKRECIMPGPPRKRQKTVHKVAELEKKINALTEALLAKHQQLDDSVSTTSPSVGHKTVSSEAPPTELTPATETSMSQHYQKKILEEAFPKGNPSYNASCPPYGVELKDSYIDVINRNYLSLDQAGMLFSFWTSKMCDTCPMVVFPPGTDVHEVRSKRPMTFLAILTISSPLLLPTYHQPLNTELTKQLAERVLFHGEKSLDLVQALILHSQYYSRPRDGRDLAFNQLIHAALVMCLELGIGRRTKVDPARSPAEMIELRRTWLACYQCASTVSHCLRQPSLIRYNSYTEECMQTLLTSPFALPSDKYLCTLVSLAHISEEVTVAFNMDDPCAEISFTEAKIQYQLRTFERQLSQWENAVNVNVDPRLVQHQMASLRLYTHEIALHQDHEVDDFRVAVLMRGDQGASGEFVTASHVASLATCLESAHQVLDSFLGLDIMLARSLCNLFIVWNTYALVVLIKLHGIVNAPDSRFGNIFAPDVKVDRYLDAMLEKLAEAAAGGHSPCAEAFGFVTKKLKTWHMHRLGLVTEDSSQAGAGGGGGRTPDPAQMGLQFSDLYDAHRHGQLKGAVTKATIASQLTEGLKGQAPGPSGFPKAAFDLPPPVSERPPSTVQSKTGVSWPTSDLNAAYDAASYGHMNWEQFDFTREEMMMFDMQMSNTGWMGYLI